MQEITATELKVLLDNGEEVQVIDIREKYECDICSINGEHIPMAEVMNNIDRISREGKVVIHCRSGGRSAAVVDALQRQFGFTNLYNLKGGILAWADEVDESLAKY